jgi:ADP-heptose:LPS heptosyltransferase
MKILIGLIEHFGDVVACEPVTRYLRAKYPDAHLSWAIQKPYRELIDSNPNINEAVVLGCLTDWIKLYKHSKNDTTYDLIVDLHVNYRWCEECRVPLVKEQGNPFVNTFEWFDYGALLEAFCVGAGLPKLSAQPKVYIKDEHRSAVDALQLPPQYCVIHRDSNSAPKDWPDEKWLALVRFLSEELKLPVVEVGSQKYLTAHRHGAPWDKAASRMPLGSLVIDLMNRTKLLETAEVIRRARFFIGIDSGPAHLANATKTPGVVLLGRLGFFGQYTPFTGYYASRSPEVRLLRNLTGPVAGLSVDEVVEATRGLHGIVDKRNTKCRNGCEIETAPALISAADPDYKRTVLKSGFFDRAWYVTHYPEVLKTSADPLDYFITVGAQSGHSPGSGFDSTWYNTQRPDLAALSDPLRHYLNFGQSEGLRPCAQPPSAVAEDSPSVERMAATLGSLSSQLKVAADSANRDGSLPRIFAFYSPELEWGKVTTAKPLFHGHDQPRVPSELGYYELCNLEVLREQVRLANEHGIAGFCFYYYLAQAKPIENYIESDIKAPFFLCANEIDDEVIQELVSIFTDNRYVKVNGKPVLVIDKTHQFPNMKMSTERWRQEAVKNGFPGLYLVTVDDDTSDPFHPRELGFDASYELPSNLVTEETLLPHRDHGRIVDYRKFASFHMGRPFPDYKRFRTVMAPWDNTPRSGTAATIHVNTDNDAYKLWLAEALVDTNRRYARDERIVFLHSWNQWCDGTYVEPDGRSGRRLLEETKEVVDSLEPLIALDQNQADPKVAVLYQRLMREKEEGAARSLQAMRQQNMHLHRQLQRTIGEIHQAFYNTRSWRLTKPLRALARVLNKSDGP